VGEGGGGSDLISDERKNKALTLALKKVLGGRDYSNIIRYLIMCGARPTNEQRFKFLNNKNNNIWTLLRSPSDTMDTWGEVLKKLYPGFGWLFRDRSEILFCNRIRKLHMDGMICPGQMMVYCLSLLKNCGSDRRREIEVPLQTVIKCFLSLRGGRESIQRALESEWCNLPFWQKKVLGNNSIVQEKKRKKLRNTPGHQPIN